MQALTRPYGVLHYRVDGPAEAPAAVFANSLGTDLRLWDAVLPLLPQDLRYIRYDKQGHGLSTLGEGDDIAGFVEKPQIGEGWINGGFAVFEPGVFDYLALDGDDGSLEVALYERLARDGKLGAYRHEGFWQCVDTLRELRLLQGLWDSGKAPWKTWIDEPRRSVAAA